MVEAFGSGSTLNSAAQLRCSKQMEEVGVNGDRSILEHLTSDLVADKEVRAIQLAGFNGDCDSEECWNRCSGRP